MQPYTIFILASDSRRLFTGVTTDLQATLREHEAAVSTSTPPRDRINKLVYIESTHVKARADARASQLRHWPRPAKVRFIQLHNPGWADLAAALRDSIIQSP